MGAGANFILLDPHLNRLYVTNPSTSMVYVFSDPGGANDTPVQLAAISFGTGSAPCPVGCAPTSVTALADGTRFYVASYRAAPSCPDPVIGAPSACVIPGLTIFDANSLSLKYPKAPTLTLLTFPFVASQFCRSTPSLPASRPCCRLFTLRAPLASGSSPRLRRIAATSM